MSHIRVAQRLVVKFERGEASGGVMDVLDLPGRTKGLSDPSGLVVCRSGFLAPHVRVGGHAAQPVRSNQNDAVLAVASSWPNRQRGRRAGNTVVADCRDCRIRFVRGARSVEVDLVVIEDRAGRLREQRGIGSLSRSPSLVVLGARPWFAVDVRSDGRSPSVVDDLGNPTCGVRGFPDRAPWAIV